jgi:hypothetical protein
VTARFSGAFLVPHAPSGTGSLTAEVPWSEEYLTLNIEHVLTEK